MDDTTQKRRLKIYNAYRRWSQEHKESVVTCMWCGELITPSTGFHTHEWLVKRSGMNPRHHDDLLFVPENVIPLHPHCHDDNGQRVEAARRALEHAARHITADKIGRWYVSLWREHDLTVPRGLYREPHEIPLYLGREMLMDGARLLCDDVLPESWIHPNDATVDVRDCAYAQFVTKKKPVHRELAAKLPDRYGGLSWRVWVDLARQGFWLHYLRGLIG